MTRQIILLFVCFITLNTFAQKSSQEKDIESILAVLDQQQKAWNNYDLEGFMKGYWQSNNLKFFGKSGITMGYENTLKRYQKSYPSKDHTGQLRFKIIDVSPINLGLSYYVMGEFHLTRTVGNANGIFMIIFKKIDGQWKIIADTSA